MPKITHQELAAWNPPGGTPGDALYQIATQVKDVACSIWSTYPYQWIPDNPVTSLIKHFWNSNCSMSPTSAPPVVPPPPDFSGGQCDGILYGVRYQTAIISGGTLAGWSANQQTTSNAPSGAIQSIELYAGGQLCPTLEHWSFNGAGVPPVFNDANRPYFLRIVDSIGTKDVAIGTASGKRFIEFFRIDGQPDNCGNPPSNFPPTSPPPPTIYNIDINDGDSIITIPITWNGDVNIPLTFVFEGGLIDFDFGGINITWNGDVNIGGNGKNPFPESPPIVITPGDDPPGGGGTTPKPDDPSVIEKPPVVVDPNNPLDEMPPPGEEIVYVEVIVNSIFDELKNAIININPSKSVYFAGYVAWSISNKPDYTLAPEIPIRRKQNLFRMPNEYDGYKVVAINGANLSVKTFTVAKNPANQE